MTKTGEVIIGAGQSLIHESAAKHVTGEATYIDDQPTYHGQLFACVGGSTIAHGEITTLNLEAVRSALGVVDVITAQSVPGKLDIGPVFPGDPLFSEGLVEYWGQPIFAVAAISHELAKKAVQLAKIDYKPLEPVLDLNEAINQEFYVRPPHRMQRGNAEQAIDNSVHRIQSTLLVGGQEHFYLEGQASTVVPQEDGGMLVYTSTQNPTETQKLVSDVLNLPMSKVDVVTRRMGGGFGGKETQAAPWSCVAAIFANRTRKVVACRLSRRDDMVMTGKRHNFINQYDVGFDDDGMISGIHYTLAGQCGYSPDLSDAIVDRAMFHCDNAYYLPHATVDGLRCKTHTVSNTAFRGFGGPQGVIAAEAVIDEIAFKLKKDPLEVRKRNLYNTIDRNITHYHQKIDSFSISAIVDQLEKESDYWSRRKGIQEFNAQSPILKKGLALTPVKFGISFTVSHLNQAGALIHLYTDGSIQVNHGGTEMGQGLMTKVAQIVASQFQVSTDSIIVTATRTDKVPNTSPTAASSGTDLNGMAALNAARVLKQRLIDFLSEKYNTPAEHIRFRNGNVKVADQTLSFAQVTNEAWLARVSLSSTGFYKTPKIHYDRETASGNPFYYFANGASVSEVVVDTLTGEYKLLRTDIIHDVGNSINPALDIGQIEGGFIQGLGWLTCEELKWNDEGRLLTDGPATYKIPAISDTPEIFNVSLLQNSPNSEATVFRSKAVGEPPLMLAISAWCGIRDAIASIDGRTTFPQLNAPATPEEILKTIHCDR
ncbi:MAG: xanthine dehydrogenase molybdopterin binding subunit [Gammaproteobacteria bacterium]|nr:xanthine dehydrogenase molybdopterin binding subunit [Gammaproteobacteria bacterium]